MVDLKIFAGLLPVETRETPLGSFLGGWNNRLNPSGIFFEKKFIMLRSLNEGERQTR